MNTEEKLQLMAEVKNKITKYLEGQRTINIAALKTYEDKSPIQESDPEIKKMRETEAQKIRDRIYELEKHIAVIELM